MARKEHPDPLQQLFLTAHPNPERIGCPGVEVLKALARQRRPGESTAESHLGECSPCFREYLEFRREWQHAQRRRRTLVLIALAIVVVVVGVRLLWRPHRLGTERASNGILRVPGLRPGVLNFQGSASRGTGQSGQKDQVLPQSTRQLSIILPTGSTAGPYMIEIRRASGSEKPVANFSGVALVDAEGITVLRANVDFSAISSGPYIVAWRHQGDEAWDVGPFVIR
jgi:hypothetical protein